MTVAVAVAVVIGGGVQSGSCAIGQWDGTCNQTDGKRRGCCVRSLPVLRSTLSCLSCLSCLSGPFWLGPSPLSRSHDLTYWDDPYKHLSSPGKLWAHVRHSSSCQSARLANRASARSDSWVALAKAGSPSLGQGCRKSGLILMVKSPGFLNAFRDMSVWSVWLFSLLLPLFCSVEQQRQQRQTPQAAAAG